MFVQFALQIQLDIVLQINHMCKECEHTHISTLNWKDEKYHFHECTYCGFERLEEHNF